MSNANTATVAAPAPVNAKKTNQTLELLKRLAKNKAAMISLIVIVILILAAIFAPVLSPYDYKEMVAENINATPSLAHPFGCDRLGRDLFSRVLIGGRWSLSLGFMGTAVSLVFAVIIGAIAGFFGQVADNIVMRVLDIIQAIPGILLSMVISTVLGPGFMQTVFALAVGGIPGNARMLRATILSIRNSEYVEAASTINCSYARIIIKHILPNAFAPLLVGAAMGIGGTIMQASMLSFVGLGVQPPTPEWGALLTDGRNYISTFPHLIAFPGIMIGIVSLALCLIGDGLRDAMDPKLKK